MSLLEGDVTQMDLGLSGAEFVDLASRTSVIHHCAAITYGGAPRALVEQVNVRGTREVLELALAAPRLERLVHWSCTAATCPTDGVVYEDELSPPLRGRIAQTRHRAERALAKARTRVPITILRPTMLVGSSVTGEAERVEGALLLIAGLLSAPREVPLPLPARADAPLNVVPVDYAATAGLALARAPESVSRTFHIVDPDPPSLQDALALFASLTGRPAPRHLLPQPLTWALLRLPVIERTAHAQQPLLDELGRAARFDDRNARPILDRTGLRCPALRSYASKLVAFVQRARETRDSARVAQRAATPGA